VSSESNVEIIRRGADHFEARGQLLVEDFAPDFVCDMSMFHNWPEPPKHDGIEGIERFLREEWGKVFDWTLEVESIHDAGERVVVVVYIRARAKATGLEFEWRAGHLWTLRNGKITHLAIYSDATEALRDAGLSASTLRRSSGNP
jgi:ketosteroid isomerase-like protein